jgi:hypothetical protein
MNFAIIYFKNKSKELSSILTMESLKMVEMYTLTMESLKMVEMYTFIRKNLIERDE